MEFEDDSHHTGTQSQHMESIIPTSPDDVEEVAATANNVVVSSQGATLSTISVTPAECVTLVKSEEHQAAEAAAAAAQAHQQMVAHAAAQTSIAAAAAQGHAVKVLEITSLDSNSQREIQQVSSSKAVKSSLGSSITSSPHAGGQSSGAPSAAAPPAADEWPTSGRAHHSDRPRSLSAIVWQCRHHCLYHHSGYEHFAPARRRVRCHWRECGEQTALHQPDAADRGRETDQRRSIQRTAGQPHRSLGPHAVISLVPLV